MCCPAGQLKGKTSPVGKRKNRNMERAASVKSHDDIGLKDEYTGMLLTAGPFGRKTKILLNQIKWLAG